MEARISPSKLPAGEERRSTLTEKTLAEIDAAVGEVSTEVLASIQSELKARLAHVAFHIPEGDSQTIILRTKGVPPFFEVTTERG